MSNEDEVIIIEGVSRKAKRVGDLAKWSGVFIALLGAFGSLAELYTAKAEIVATSQQSEAELVKTIEELQDTVVEMDARLRVIEALARPRIVEFGVDEKGEKKSVKKKPLRKRKLRSTRKPWAEQRERGD